jgi:hypothetical protein
VDAAVDHQEIEIPHLGNLAPDRAGRARFPTAPPFRYPSFMMQPGFLSPRRRSGFGQSSNIFGRWEAELSELSELSASDKQ